MKLFIFVLFLFPFYSQAGASLAELKLRFEALQYQYKLARDQGDDVTEIQRLLPEIKRSYKRRDKKKLAYLLEQVDLLLQQYSARVRQEKPAVKLLSTPNDHPSLKLLVEESKYTGFHNLLLYRGNEKNIDANGGLGRNTPGFSDVAVQRDAIWLAKRAVVENNEKLAEHVIKAIDYAFQRQSTQGYFKNGLGVSSKKAINADAFFLSSFAQIYYIFENSTFKDKYFERINRHKPSLMRSLIWLKNNQDELYRQDKKTANRLLFDALAFMLNGQILEQQQFIDVGTNFLNRALLLQRSDGTFNEHGGYDSSYQAVSILNLAQLWIYTDDDQLRSRIYPHLVRAVEWQKSRIDHSGKVLVAGNSRTGLGQEKFFGKVKNVNYAEVAMSFYYWSYISGEIESAQIADTIVEFISSKRRQ